jgi:Flp pilus assembly pilin Flp
MRDESGLTTFEYGLLATCLSIWCVIALGETQLLSRPF